MIGVGFLRIGRRVNPDAVLLGRFIGRHVQIAGDCLTGPQIAEVFGRACGVPARFRQVPVGQLRAFDEEVARMFGWMDRRAPASPALPPA